MPTVASTAKGSSSRGGSLRLAYRAKSASRTPVARLLPSHVRAECRKLAARGAECALTEAEQLHERLEIQPRYGVTRRRLQNYLVRLCKQETANRRESAPADSPSACRMSG